MRILFCSMGGLGHTLPLIPMAQACLRLGHRVYWATSEDTRSHLHAHGIETTRLGAEPTLYSEQTHAQLPELLGLHGRDRASAFGPKFFQLIAQDTLDPLRRIVQEYKPDFIVYEPGLLSAPLVAAEHHIASIHHAFGIRRPLSRLHATALAVEPLWDHAGIPIPGYGSFGRSDFIDLTPPCLVADANPTQRRVWPMRVQSAHPAGQTQTNPLLEAWLAERAGEPLVYLSFGTVQHGNPMLKLAAQALAELPIRLLVTSADPMLAETLSPMGKRVLVCHFVSQALVLPHCQCVVSHAGSGTFLGALAAGVPQLALPQAADQFLNADALVQTATGLSLEPHQQTAQTIAAHAWQLLTLASFSARAGVVAREWAQMPSADAVAQAAFTPSTS